MPNDAEHKEAETKEAPEKWSSDIDALCKQTKFDEAIELALKSPDEDLVPKLTGALLNGKLLEDVRLENGTVEKFFTALLGQLKTSKDSDNTSLLKAIAMILVVKADEIQGSVIKDDFETILSQLRLDYSQSVRAQATLAAVKFLEAASSRAESILKNYVVDRVQKQNQSGLIEAFSAAAVLFPVIPATAATLFLAQGFVADLKRVAEKTSSSVLKKSALELLSAACTDTACRDTISKECTSWLEDLTKVVEPGAEKETALAALVLAKTQYKDQDSSTDLVARFQDMLVSEDTSQTSIEGLAYRSIDPKVKERLCKDTKFLQDLVKRLREAASTSEKPDSVLFGGLTVLSNVTIHQQKQTSDQKRMAQLKAYANRQTQPTDNPLESDERVNQRCIAIIEAGAVSLLVIAAAKATPTLAALISTTLNSLTVPLSTRGKVAQQGGFELALRLAEVDLTSQDDVLFAIKHQAALAMARLLVKLDPHLLFDSKRRPDRAIRPLQLLLQSQQDDRLKNLWPVLESLMALTNLATLADADDTIADAIVAACWDDIEAATLANALAIRRAAVQAVCNLCSMSERAILKYTSPDDKQGETRMRILVAFIHADEDRGVLLAAGAALASLLSYGGAARFVLDDRSVEKTVAMVAKPDMDAQLRALAMFEALLVQPDESAQAVVSEVKKRALKAKGVEAFQAAAKNPALAGQAKACLQVLQA